MATLHRVTLVRSEDPELPDVHYDDPPKRARERAGHLARLHSCPVRQVSNGNWIVDARGYYTDRRAD